ncbi:MAG: YdjY domain-containing protein [Planctomycetota bacterium]
MIALQILAPALLAPLLTFSGAAPGAPAQDPAGPGLPDAKEAAAALERAFADAGVRVDSAAKALCFPVSVQVRDELLEYLLVNPHGAVHEALFVTQAPAEILNAALLALGLERGENVQYVKKDPQPSEEELRAGARAFDIVPPTGPGVHLYASWKEGDETYFYRVEDLIRDLERGRTMRRHAWVYLGSRWIEGRRNQGQPMYAAAAEGNLACVAFFSQGNTLLTAALPECVAQSSWLPNGWLLPRVGADVLLIASLAPLQAAPASMQASVPTVLPEAPEPDAAPGSSEGAAPAGAGGR